jgi:membrane protein YfhO
MESEPAPPLRRLPRLRQTHTSAAVLFAVLALLFVSPALVPGHTLASTDYLYQRIPWSADPPAGFDGPANTELYDPAFQYIPWLHYTRDQLAAGGDLLWNPYIGAGRPYLANMQSAIVSPFSVLAYLLPFWWSLGLIAAVKLFLASFGTYLFGRRLGRSWPAAVLSGATFAFGLYVVVHLLYPFSSVYALIPWLLLAVHALSARPALGPALGLAGLVAGCLVAGHPESAFHALLLAAAYLTYRLVVLARGAPDGRAVALRAGTAFVAAGALGALIAGVVLVPFVELLRHSADFENRSGNDSALSLHWGSAIVFPDYLGSPGERGGEGLYVARALYAGALPLMLALVALVPLGARLQNRWNRVPADDPTTGQRTFFAGVAAVALAVSFGLPGLFDLVKAVPVLGQANNSRMAVLYLFAVALLAGFGVDDLHGSRATAGRRRTQLGVAVGLAVLPLLLVALRDLPPPGAAARGVAAALGLRSANGDIDVIHARAVVWWVVFAVLALALVAARLRGRLAAGPFAALAIGIACLDLFRIGVGFNPALSTADATLPTTPAIRRLQADRPARFVSFFEGFATDQSMSYRLQDARSYDFPVLQRYDVAWRRYVFPLAFTPGAPQGVLSLNPRSLRVLGLLGVRDVLVRRDLPAYARRLRLPVSGLGLSLPGVHQVYEGPDGRIFRNDRALPRGFVVHAQHLVRGADESLAALGDVHGPPLGRVAITERPVAGLASDAAGAPPPSPARIVSYGPSEVVLETRASRPGLAVLSDSWFPGWKATVDGRSTPIERVDYLVRGVRVPAGRSRIVMRYEPASFTAGLGLSIAGLAIALGGVLVLVMRRRRAA